jgi:hypothetical protein
VAALMPFNGDDWEDFVVARHPGFLELLRRSREHCPTGQGIPLEEIKGRYGISRTKSRRRRSAR